MAWIFWSLIVIGPASIFDLVTILTLSSGSSITFIILTQAALMAYGYYRIRKMELNNLFFVAAESQKGTTIVKELWEEVMLIEAAICFILPGFATAAIGGILFFTPTRLILLEALDQSQ